MSLSGEPIVILGTFRGGTSCLARALVEMGLFMGEPNAFQAANEFNKGGFWELEDMQALNAQLLVAYGMTYLGADHMSPAWREMPASDYFLTQARAMLDKHFAGREHWGWKEPATTSLFPLYKHVLAEEGVHPRYAISVRHPLSVASSRKRQFLIKNADAGLQSLLPPDEQRALGMWVDYMLTNLVESKGSPRYMISYEDLLEQPKEQLTRMAECFLPWKPTAVQLQASIDTINPEWSHSRYSMEDLEPWPSIVMRTYQVCLKAAGDQEGFNAGNFDQEIDALWDEWQTTNNMVRSMQIPAGHLITSWRENGEVKHDDQPFTPTGTWQVLRAKIASAPGEPIQITMYQTPCVVWIKSAIWHAGDQEIQAPLMAGPNGFLDKPDFLRLISVGPGALTSKSPDVGGPYELEIEFLLQFDINSLNAVTMILKSRLDAARRASPR